MTVVPSSSRQDTTLKDIYEKLKNFDLIYIAAAILSHASVEMGRKLLKISQKWHVHRGANGEYHETFDIENQLEFFIFSHLNPR